MDINKFRLVINGVFFFNLTKKNYRSIIANDHLRYAVTTMIEKMEKETISAYVDSFRDGYIQIDRL